MRADVLRETALLNGLLTLVGLATTNLLDWLLLQPALPVLTGLALLNLLVLTLILVRPISGRVSKIDGLMLLTVGLVWVALQVAS